MSPEKKKNKQDNSVDSPHPNNQEVFLNLNQVQGPIPTADEILQYDKVLPGLGGRIVRWAEDEQKHRIDMEYRGQLADITERFIGQCFGMTAILATLYTSIELAHAGHPITAGFVGVSGISSVALAFIQGRKANSNRS